MAMKFTPKLFEYFDLANKNVDNKEWFTANRQLFEQEVKAPMENLVFLVKTRLMNHPAGEGIDLEKKLMIRGLRPSNRASDGIVKNFCAVDLAQKRVSLYEWNPGIHLQIGARPDDNFYGLGAYMVSSRQLKLIRENLVDDYQTFHKILKAKKFKQAWGELQGERYKRFPRGFDEDHKSSEYLWYKQFYVGKELTRKKVCDKNFFFEVADDLEAGFDLLDWLKKTVGVAKNPKGY